MSQLIDFIRNHCVSTSKPQDRDVDVIFFGVRAVGGPTLDGLRAAIAAHKGEFCELDPFDGRPHSYIELGAWVGDQGTALCLIGLGTNLGAWDLLTPRDLVRGGGSEAEIQRLAGQGYLGIKPKNEDFRVSCEPAHAPFDDPVVIPGPVSIATDELAERLNVARDEGVAAARDEVQPVYLDVDDLPMAPPLDGLGQPFVRIAWREVDGNPRAGVPAMRGWVLAADQSGTQLLALLQVARRPLLERMRGDKNDPATTAAFLGVGGLLSKFEPPPPPPTHS